jgi:predicted metal-dependent hydrolase
LNQFLKDEFTHSHLNLMANAIRLYNAKKYWECHENLEHYWLEEPGPIRNIYWAVIQVAAAMIHYRESNLIGASGLLKKAKEKFQRVEKYNLENELLYEFLSWKILKKKCSDLSDEPKLDDFADLYEFKFKEPELWKTISEKF